MTRTLVVGGGISGLAGAHALVEAGHDVVLWEASDRLGGKILTTPFAGRPVDEGPDAFLLRVPDAEALCRRLGLAGALVHPATGQAAVWLGGRLRPLPEGLVLGAPLALGPLRRSRVLSPAGLVRAGVERWLPGRPVTGDVAVGRLVRRRYGRQVDERLVDPLVGGITAGSSDELSLEVVAAPLAAAARRGASLTRGLRAECRRSGAPSEPAPLFAAPPGGMGTLVAALAGALAGAGAEIRLGTALAALEPTAAGGFRAAAGDGAVVDVDRVLCSLPAWAAAPVLRSISPAASHLLAAVDHASVGVVTLAYPAGAFRSPPEGSGFLVPRREGRLVTACSIFTNKWPAPGPAGTVVLRASVGRRGDQRALGLDDGALVERVDAEVGQALGIGREPTEARVSRWPRALPQFRPGHLGRMAEAQAALAEDAPGLALAGAYLRGVGIPACIGGAVRAATDLDGRRR